jgi:hypothetical protein
VTKKWFKKLHTLTEKIKLIAPHIIVVGACVVAAALKLNNIPDAIPWNGDTARDLLAGKLLAQGLVPDLDYGHYNSGILYYYPSHYYYIMAGLFTILSNQTAIIMFFSFLHLLPVILFYQILIIIFKRPMPSALVTFLFAVAPEALRMSFMVISAHFAYVLFIVGLYFFTRFWFAEKDQDKKVYLLLAASILAFSTSIFYGGVLFVPIVFILCCSQKKIKEAFLFSVTFLIVFIGSYFSLIAEDGLLPLLGENVFKYKQIGTPFDFAHLQNSGQVLSQHLQTTLGLQYKLILLVWLVGSAWLYYKKEESFRLVLFLHGIIIYHWFFVMFKSGSFQSQYLVLLLPFYFLLISILLIQLWKRSLLLGIAFFIGMQFLISFPFNNYNQYAFSKDNTFKLRHFEKFYEYISRQYGEIDIIVVTESGDESYYTRVFMNLRDDQLNRSYLSDEANQVILVPTTPERVVVCLSTQDFLFKECEEYMQKYTDENQKQYHRLTVESLVFHYTIEPQDL